MAVYKRKNKKGTTYQVKVRGSDGSWISETYPTRIEADKREIELREQKQGGFPVRRVTNNLTLSQYFGGWFDETKGGNTSEGWRSSQFQMYRDYIDKVIGGVKIRSVTPAHIRKVISMASQLGRSPQTCQHIYNLLHKLFEDAIEMYQVVDRNPVLKKLKPRVPQKESKFLKPDEARKLLTYVKGKPYGLAVWLGVLAGMRIGEVQALRWDAVDLKTERLTVRGTYLRKEKKFQDFPKGRKQHHVDLPLELVQYLREEKIASKSEFVVPSRTGGPMCYHSFYGRLKKYCKAAGVLVIASHALRHSASELYMESGASRDDLRILFNHSTSAVTDRYVHDKGERLKDVAKRVTVGSITFTNA